MRDILVPQWLFPPQSKMYLYNTAIFGFYINWNIHKNIVYHYIWYYKFIFLRAFLNTTSGSSFQTNGMRSVHICILYATRTAVSNSTDEHVSNIKCTSRYSSQWLLPRIVPILTSITTVILFLWFFRFLCLWCGVGKVKRLRSGPPRYRSSNPGLAKCLSLVLSA
jgi:hypothetical protein